MSIAVAAGERDRRRLTYIGSEKNFLMQSPIIKASNACVILSVPNGLCRRSAVCKSLLLNHPSMKLQMVSVKAASTFYFLGEMPFLSEVFLWYSHISNYFCPGNVWLLEEILASLLQVLLFLKSEGFPHLKRSNFAGVLSCCTSMLWRQLCGHSQGNRHL